MILREKEKTFLKLAMRVNFVKFVAHLIKFQVHDVLKSMFYILSTFSLLIPAVPIGGVSSYSLRGRIHFIKLVVYFGYASCRSD